MSQAPHTEAVPHTELQAHESHAGHPGQREYIKIALILIAITAAEVLAYYIQALRPLQLLVFGVFSLTKFTLVAMFFMHLKFDSRFFSVIFVTGLLLAVTVFLIFLTMLRIFFV